MDNLSSTTPSPAMRIASADLTGQTLDDFHVLRKLGETPFRIGSVVEWKRRQPRVVYR